MHETPDIITPNLWLASSPDRDQVDYWILEKLQECVPQPDSWRRPADVALYRKAGIFQPDDQLIIDEEVSQWRSRLQAAFEHVEDILNADIKYVWLLHLTVNG